MMTFGTRDGAPHDRIVKNFQEHNLRLVTDVALGIQTEFSGLSHDMSRGSDGIIVVDSLVMQAAAELWAAERILEGEMALLTMFHHVRALYEAHALSYWLLQDFRGRWPRVLKERQVERERFEKAAAKSIGPVATDITEAGQVLIKDATIRRLPKVFDMIKGHPDLELDHAVFWKYSSAHTHPGFTFTAEVDPHSERTMVEQILGGLIRHACGVYREVVNHFALESAATLESLSAAEKYSAYRFDAS
ncbi:MAG: hypothetical protein ABI625_23275 [bacterium]